MLRRIDWRLVLPVAVLLFIGLITIFSISPTLFRSQLIFTVISTVLFVIFSQLDIQTFRFYKLPIYIFSLLGLVFLLFLGIESHGAVRWLDIFGFRIQFSEVFKPFLCLTLAAFLADRQNISFTTFAKVLGLLVPVAFLIYKQPDLGTALIYILTTIVTLILYGFPLMWFGIGILGMGLSFPLIWQFLHEYQRERVLTFLHLSNDPLGTSYNAIQAIIAIGSGMFLGKGLGQGTQSTLRFLPEKQTDFIFATVSEDLGFIGAAIVIVAFIFLLYRFYVIFRDTDELYTKVVVITAFSLILVQFFVNIAMNIGIVPVVGVTLPFVSYGGSSLLSNAILLGLVSSVGSMTRRKHVLEIR